MYIVYCKYTSLEFLQNGIYLFLFWINFIKPKQNQMDLVFIETTKPHQIAKN